MTDQPAPAGLTVEDAVRDLVRSAFISGCEAVQANYHPYNDPEFGEAGDDYAASVDYTDLHALVTDHVRSALEAERAKTRDWQETATRTGDRVNEIARQCALAERQERDLAEKLDKAVTAILRLRAGESLGTGFLIVV